MNYLKDQLKASINHWLLQIIQCMASATATAMVSVYSAWLFDWKFHWICYQNTNEVVKLYFRLKLTTQKKMNVNEEKKKLPSTYNVYATYRRGCTHACHFFAETKKKKSFHRKIYFPRNLRQHTDEMEQHRRSGVEEERRKEEKSRKFVALNSTQRENYLWIWQTAVWFDAFEDIFTDNPSCGTWH